MEYELKKSQILSQVQYTSLLSFSLVQNKLQKNFKNIVNVLMLNQNKIDELINNQIEAKQHNSNQFGKLHGLVNQINQRLQSLQIKQKNAYSNNSSTPSQQQDSKKRIERQQTNFTVKSSDQNRIADSLEFKMNDWQKKWNDDKQEMMKQVSSIKDNLNGLGFFENEVKTLRDQFKTIKDNLLFTVKKDTFDSIKAPIKRSSTQNSISNKPFQNSIKQPNRNSIINSIKQEEKENKPQIFINNPAQDSCQNLLNETVQKQINPLYLELNMMKIYFEDLKDLVSDNRKQIVKNISSLSECKQDFLRQVKTRKTQNEDIHKNIKEIKMQLLSNLSSLNTTQIEPEDKFINESEKSLKGPKKEDDDANYKNQLNDKVLRLQAMVQNLITQSQFDRLKNVLNDQLEKIQKKHKSYQTDLQNTEKKLLNLILQNQSSNDSQFDDLKNGLAILQENYQNQENQNQRKNNILNAKIQEVKKSIQNLREDLQFYQSINTQNNQNAHMQDKLQEIIRNSNQNKTHGEFNQKMVEPLKKYFNGKIHDLRINLLGSIRDLQKKINNRPNGDQQFIKIWDKLNEFKLFLNKKADQDDSKKSFLYLQKQINRINNLLLKNQQNTQDARIARSNNWHCLSCDKSLITYQGKIGKHVAWDSMPLKGMNKTISSQQYQSTQQQDKKKGFPQLKK